MRYRFTPLTDKVALGHRRQPRDRPAPRRLRSAPRGNRCCRTLSLPRIRRTRRAGERSRGARAPSPSSSRLTVSQAGDVAHLVEAVQHRLGIIDILINNAGITRPQPIEAITERDWDDLDRREPEIHVPDDAKPSSPAMRSRRWGRIVNLSSVAAQVGGKVVGPHYAAVQGRPFLGLTHAYGGPCWRRKASPSIAVRTSVDFGRKW